MINNILKKIEKANEVQKVELEKHEVDLALVSVLPDKKEVSGLDDLKRYLVDDRIDQLGFSMLKHLAIYATGRNLTFNELEFLKKEGLKLKANGYRMQDMILFVVNSRIFTEK